MKLVLLLFLTSASAQQNDDYYIHKAHLSWNHAAMLAHVWADQHSEFTISRKDKELFHNYLEAEHQMEKDFRQIGYK